MVMTETKKQRSTTTTKKRNSHQGGDAVSLSALCAEMKLDPRLAREKLRLAVRDPTKYPALAAARTPRTPWQWAAGSEAQQEARRALGT
jgi:hypothetical protein